MMNGWDGMNKEVGAMPGNESIVLFEVKSS